jgi:hypothetical protein
LPQALLKCRSPLLICLIVFKPDLAKVAQQAPEQTNICGAATTKRGQMAEP